VVRKTRYVDKVYFRKLFETHSPSTESSIDNVPLADVTVVTDFGHGAITPRMIQSLCDRPNLAVNAQTNSSNIGFNLITKYPRADYVVIDEPEARLAAGDRDGDIKDVILKLAMHRYKKMVVTMGVRGAIGWDGEFTHCPAYTDKALDTMGAGDAFFAVTAPMMHGSMRDLLRIGNAAGALKCQIVGHRKPVTKEQLIAFLRGVK
jgi:bifunctional ADP-heptose synthase (sugar kinase/adenylyltransferase)